MRKENNLLLFSILILILIFVVFLFALKLNSSYLEKREIYTSLKISDKLGVDVNETALIFGEIVPGSSSTRNVKLVNNYNFPIKIETSVRGDIKDFLDFDKIVFADVNETKIIKISASVSFEEEKGNYSGTVVFLIRKDI